MNHKLLMFDGQSLSTEMVEAPGRLRWACWSARGSALLVGDRGTALVYEDGRFRRLRTHVAHNLRCADFSPDGTTAYICGNSGALLTTDLQTSEVIQTDVRGNLRRLGWSPRGDRVILVGNDGEAYSLEEKRLEKVHGAETNLRSIAWHPGGDYALVAGNCFRSSVGSLTPSPNLFRYERGLFVELRDISESRADLTSSSWRPKSSQCLIVGYDQTWHTPTSNIYDEGAFRETPWSSDHLFPTSCAWHPSGEYALVGTGLMRAGEGDCSLYRYDDEGIKKLLDLGQSGVSCIAWSGEGRAFILASTSVRAFSV
jgi:WD40 repeat protein